MIELNAQSMHQVGLLSSEKQNVLVNSAQRNCQAWLRRLDRPRSWEVKRGIVMGLSCLP